MEFAMRIGVMAFIGVFFGLWQESLSAGFFSAFVTALVLHLNPVER